MKGDFSRSTFQPDKHYSGVRMQQGRVQLDADWNEQVDIQVNRDETASKDLIGPSGAPSDNPGFEITAEGNNLKIGQGRYYVDGILCENDDDVYYTEQLNKQEQPDLPRTSLPTVNGNGTYLAYLDVWQRHITPLEDPDIREVALGGPDTTTRTKTVWQVKLLSIASISQNPYSGTGISEWDALMKPPDGQMSAQAISAGGGYQRLENQLYRVEIHKSGKHGVATFKWSRDNGSVVTSWDAQSLSGSVLTVGSTGRDQALGFAPGQWVELTDDDRELWNEPGIMVQIMAASERSLSIKPVDDGYIYLTDNEAQESATSLTLSSTAVGNSLPTFTARTAGSGGIPTFRRPKVRLLVSNTPLILAADGEFATLESDLNGLALINGKLGDGNIIEIGGSLPGGTVVSVPGTFTYGEDNDGTTVQDLINEINSVFNGKATATLGRMPKFADFGANPKVRRWDFTEPLDSMTVCVPEENEGWIELEDGVRIQFTSGDYRTGDYWLIPARTFDADIEWPKDGDVPTPLPPHGTAHNYCRLALLEYDGSKFALLNDYRCVFPTLTDINKLRYISGDGQEAMPGDELPQHLRVGVFIGRQPLEEAKVRFEIVGGGGILREKVATNPQEGIEITLPTDPSGIAACSWELPSYYDVTPPDEQEARRTQLQVKATLVDDGDQPLNEVSVYFTATLSLAEEVAYDTTKDDPLHHLPESLTTQDALDQLRANSALHIIGGDGQEARPGEELPQPLEVIVTNGKWRHEGAGVRFTVTSGGELQWRSDDSGSLVDPSSNTSTTSLDIHTDAEGMASCHWTLPAIDGTVPSYKQCVVVEMVDDSDPSVSLAKPVHFNASLNLADNVTYKSDTPDTLLGTGTVQTALDTLDAEKVNRHGGDIIEGHVDIVADSSSGTDPLLTVQGGLTIGNVPAETSVRPDLFVHGDVSVGGNLTVSGSTTTVDTAELKIEDNIITVNKFEGTTWPTAIQYAGLEVYRGENAGDVEELKAKLLWDEFARRWKIKLPEKNPVEIATVDQLPSGVIKVIHQPGHDLNPGDAICYRPADGGYVKARSDSGETAGIFLVSRVGMNEENESDPECFTLMQAGYIDALAKLTDDGSIPVTDDEDNPFLVGEYYYVSSKVAGALTPDEPLRISNPIFLADSDHSGYVLPYRPSQSIQRLGVLQADPQAPEGALFVDRTGKLGIGTAAPVEKLHVDGNCLISGNLQIQGEATEVNTSRLDVKSNVIRVNRSEDDTPTAAEDDITGLVVHRGTEEAAQLIWDESEDCWKMGTEGDLTEVATIDRLPSGVARIVGPTEHDFTVGEVLYFDGTRYQRALSDQEATTGMFMVSQIGIDERGNASDHHFTVVQAGFIEGLEELKDVKEESLKAGEYYYVSDSVAGTLTPVEPLRISNPIFLADSDQSGYVLPYRPGESIQHVLHELRVLQADPDAPEGALFVDQAGNLGIGTKEPYTKLHIASGSEIKPGDKSSGYQVIGSASGKNIVMDHDQVAARKADEVSALHFQADGGDLVVHDHQPVEREFVIKDSGKVGIGTKEPYTKLHISSGKDVKRERIKLKDRSSGYLVIGRVSARNIVMDDNEITARNADKVSPLHFQADGGDLVVHYHQPVEKEVVIKDSGNVGLGTKEPVKKLEVEGEARVNGNLSVGPADSRGFGEKGWITWGGDPERFILASRGRPLGLGTDGNGNHLFMSTTGNVGIGTATPGEKLEVAGTVKASAFQGDGSGLTGISAGKWSDGPNSAIYFNTGNVGIGTTDPTQGTGYNFRMTVKGNNYRVADFKSSYDGLAAIRISTANNSSRAHIGVFGQGTYITGRNQPGNSYDLVIDDDGNVGIGTTDPGSDKLDVRGRCYASGGWHGINSDYAEYFESTRATLAPGGTSVVLTKNGKIRPAKKDEIPVGVVSDNPAIVGNSYKEWPKKYLIDEFGNVIMEEYEEEVLAPKKEKVTREHQKVEKKKIEEEVTRVEVVKKGRKYIQQEITETVTREVEEPVFKEVNLYDTAGKKVIGRYKVPVMESYEEEIDVLDEDGNPVMEGTGEFVTKERPKLNPEYDESKEYIPREDRPEWNCVGLLGQLPLRKDQPVAPSWVKIKDISDDVELWLVK